MTRDDDRVERLLALTRRLTDALLADVDALERGNPQAMASIQPETQQFVAIYAREAAAVRTVVKTLPPATREALRTATSALHRALAQHERRLTRVRNASEGMIRAIVEDVERRKRVTRTYSPGAIPRPTPGAMIYNGVV